MMADVQKLCKDMVDYIEASTETIDALKSKPSFDNVVLTKTAEDLASAGLIRDDEVNAMVDLFKEDPNKALVTLQKIAEDYRTVEDFSLGAPEDSVKKTAFDTTRASDRALFEKLNLT
jgi:hypothetical protein